MLLRLARLFAAFSFSVVVCVAEDPWNEVMWSTDSAGEFRESEPSVVVFGLSFGGASCLDVAGHAVVVHAPDGTRVGCGVIDANSGIANIGSYPGYTGTLSVAGTAVVTAEGVSSILFTGSLQTGSGGSFPASASGGIHIHTGTSCSTADAVGGHFYSEAYSPPTLDGPDYWMNVQWATDGAGCMNPQIDQLTVPGYVLFAPSYGGVIYWSA